MLALLLASAEGLLLAPTAPRCRPLRMAEMMAPADTSLIQIEADADAVGKAVLAKVDLAAAKAISERGHFALAIPGGSVLKMLKGSKPEWADKCTLAYVNHKAVAMDDAELATHAKAGVLFLSGWTGCDTIVMDGTADAVEEAAAYEAKLQALPENRLPRTAGGLPCFDMMLVGVGDDGHVGSLYPGRDEVLATQAWVLPVELKTPGSISLSLPVMAAAKQVVIAACGVSDKYPQGKSDAMRRAIEGEESPSSFPASGLRPVATWVLDEAAASKLSAQPNFAGTTQLVQGASLKTWSYGALMEQVEQVQLVLSTEGRPLEADIEIWQGPDNTPCKVRVYIEDGKLRPFNAVIETPRGPNTVAVRNLGNIQFPIAATVFADTAPRPSRRPPPAAGAWVEGMEPAANLNPNQLQPQPASSSQTVVAARRKPPPATASLTASRLFQLESPSADALASTLNIQGGALRTYPFDPSVDSVEVCLSTDGRPLNARIELLQGPNNNKQVIELYTEDGLDRPFFCVLESPGSSNTVRVINTAPVEFPLIASVVPRAINTGGHSGDVVISGDATGYGGGARV